MNRRLAWFAAALALACFALAWAVKADPVPGSPEYREFYSAFASKHCCWTNECCRRASEHEFEALDQIGQRWRVKSTGQELDRTGWSPDGAFHVCQCNYSVEKEAWVKLPTSNARCLFPPLPGF